MIDHYKRHTSRQLKLKKLDPVLWRHFQIAFNQKRKRYSEVMGLVDIVDVDGSSAESGCPTPLVFVSPSFKKKATRVPVPTSFVMRRKLDYPRAPQTMLRPTGLVVDTSQPSGLHPPYPTPGVKPPFPHSLPGHSFIPGLPHHPSRNYPYSHPSVHSDLPNHSQTFTFLPQSSWENYNSAQFPSAALPFQPMHTINHYQCSPVLSPISYPACSSERYNAPPTQLPTFSEPILPLQQPLSASALLPFQPQHQHEHDHHHQYEPRSHHQHQLQVNQAPQYQPVIDSLPPALSPRPASPVKFVPQPPSSNEPRLHN